MTEIVTSPTSTEWEFEWSSQWRELVAAVGYDIDRFDDDDEAEENAQAIARSPSSVKKAVVSDQLHAAAISQIHSAHCHC